MVSTVSLIAAYLCHFVAGYLWHRKFQGLSYSVATWRRMDGGVARLKPNKPALLAELGWIFFSLYGLRALGLQTFSYHGLLAGGSLTLSAYWGRWRSPYFAVVFGNGLVAMVMLGAVSSLDLYIRLLYFLAGGFAFVCGVWRSKGSWISAVFLVFWVHALWVQQIFLFLR